MKRTLSFLLAMVMLLGLLSGCRGQDVPTETTLAGSTQSPEEQAVLKVLTIGNSHGLDANQMLYEVFQKEAPEQKVEIAALHIDSCTMEMHANNIRGNLPAYAYYQYENGTVKVTPDMTVQQVLLSEEWDVVVMNQMHHRLGIESKYVASEFKTVADHILENSRIKPQIWFHVPWTSPDDYETYLNPGAPLSLGGTDFARTENWKKNHEDAYGDENGIYKQILFYNAQINCVKKFIVDSTDFLGKSYFSDVLPSTTPIQYAQDVLGLTEAEIYRDYTHLSDYGRLIVAYYWYAKLMGLSSIDKVDVDSIPAGLHQQKSTYPVGPEYTITQKMKDDIVKAVNWTLEHPYELPAQ